jgi:hypothetical protein
MTKITKVLFHREFTEGEFNFATATDLAHMSDEEVERMSVWLADVVAGKEHVGANKPSGFSKGIPIVGAELYRDNNIWHYHCGPYKAKDYGTALTDNTLGENLDGHHSAQVYHYAKHADTIIVLGYSRLHNPFPTQSSKKNPVVGRGMAVENTVDFV